MTPMTRAALALLLALAASPALAQTYAGSARVIDGDSIELAGKRTRLFAIDAPELRQTCAGRDGRTYECGRDARAVLAELVRGKTVSCIARDHDKYGRVVATCTTDAGDLGAAMVRRGWALPYLRYGGAVYLPAEAEAKRERLGMWSGRFQTPEDFRRERR